MARIKKDANIPLRLRGMGEGILDHLNICAQDLDGSLVRLVAIECQTDYPHTDGTQFANGIAN